MVVPLSTAGRDTPPFQPTVSITAGNEGNTSNFILLSPPVHIFGPIEWCLHDLTVSGLAHILDEYGNGLIRLNRVQKLSDSRCHNRHVDTSKTQHYLKQYSSRDRGLIPASIYRELGVWDLPSIMHKNLVIYHALLPTVV